MRKANERVLKGLAALLAVSTAVSCVDEKIVERIVEVERDLFETPSESAAGMLGYSDMESKLTVCGNCHVGPQSKWEQTGHADAWAGLQDSGHAQTFCEGCHTVNQLGNIVADTVGYLATGEDRYHDVQCESCHGPGLDHVSNPADANIPLAPIATGVDNTEGCGECHQGAHHPFAEQWETSGHASIGFMASRPECQSCHEGGGALAAWGETADYLEGDDPQAITCAVCHDPHGSDNSAQLRFAVGGVPIEQNLCSQCHNRRPIPVPNNDHGLSPHSPHTALLTGEAGFVFPGMSLEQVYTTHGSVTANANLCATCHVAQITVTNEETGDFEFQGVGHGFNAAPCLGEDGKPTTEDCELTSAARSFAGCTAAGCHTGGEDVAASILRASANEIRLRAEELEALIDAVRAMDPSVIDPSDNVITTAEGAFFNLELARFSGSGRAEALLTYAGGAAHNGFLIRNLLAQSITAMENDYPVAASPSYDRTMPKRFEVR